jgi:transporter family protein
MGWLGWALASAVFAALTAILAKVGVAGVNSNLATAVRTCVVLVFTWLMVWLNPAVGGLKGGLSGLTQRNWVFLVLSGMATGLSWLCYFRALQLGPASRVAPIDKLSVVLVIVLATLVLGERMTWAKGVGGLLIVAGAIVIALER